jgi:DNA polymerase III delta prime subunit
MSCVPLGLTRQSRTPATSDTEKALHSLMAAMSQFHLSGLDLRLPILLKGMSGVGKFTAILNVARRLGLNVQEVFRLHK